MGDDTVDPPVTLSALEKCVTGGGTVAEAWSVSNQHGPVSSITAGALVVLGSDDGSVKQWTIEGDEPSYGKPFTTSGSRVAALTLTGGHVLAATGVGISEWSLADASATRTLPIADVQLTAVAATEAQVFAGTSTGELFALDVEQVQLESALWGVASVEIAAANRLYTSGHWYFTPMVERRAVDAPMVVVETWQDEERQGWVRAVASDGTKLVVAGDKFVAAFAPDSIVTGPIAITDVADHDPVGVVLLPGGELFATAGREGTLRVWKTATAELVSTLTIPPPIGLARDTDGTRLYTSGADGRLHAFGCR